MAVKYTNIFPLQGPPKHTQIGIFGLKIKHLATLVGGLTGKSNFAREKNRLWREKITSWT
jgi:hypothetical protein